MATIFKRPRLALAMSSQSRSQCQRGLHANMTAPRIPKPTPFVPDTQTFLTLIGRNLSQHAAKIPSWEALFSLSSQQLRDSGIEPARSRRYLLRMRERFRNGTYGLGGDLQEVADGVGELRIAETPNAATRAGKPSRGSLTRTPGMKKVVVNVPAGEGAPSTPVEIVQPVKMVKIIRSGVITGPKVEALKGAPGAAKIRVREGLWEQRRGHKVDGGERRKAEVRAKRRAAERKT